MKSIKYKISLYLSIASQSYFLLLAYAGIGKDEKGILFYVFGLVMVFIAVIYAYRFYFGLFCGNFTRNDKKRLLFLVLNMLASAIIACVVCRQ